MDKCTGERCPIQAGYDVSNCKSEECRYRTTPSTNYEIIKAMSIEELTVFLDGFGARCLECGEPGENNRCPIYKEGNYCRPQDIMDWLKKE